MRSLSILLCGYGWFAGIPEGETNNAELIARALERKYGAADLAPLDDSQEKEANQYIYHRFVENK